MLAERVREVSRGTYRGPPERVSFEDVAQSYLKHAEENVRPTTLKDYRCNLIRHLMPWLQAGCGTFGGPTRNRQAAQSTGPLTLKRSARTSSNRASGRGPSTSA